MAFVNHKSLDTTPVVLAPEDAAQAARLLSLLRSHLAPTVGRVTRVDERAELAKEIHDARRARDRLFPSEMFADPAWDILLILYWSNHAEQRMTITNVCAAAAVPPTTALRWIESLCGAGLVRKARHPTDARVRWLDLTPDANEKLDQYFDDLLDNRAFPHVAREGAA